MEGQPQQPQDEGEQQRFKTFGVRLDEDLHAQLSFIAQLTGSTITDEIRRSIEARVKSAQEDPELVERAEAVRAEIEREAAARQHAIAGFFGKTAVAGGPQPSTSSRRRGTQSRGSADA